MQGGKGERSRGSSRKRELAPGPRSHGQCHLSLPSLALGRPPSPPLQQSARPPGAQAALGPHLSFGSRDARERGALSLRGAGARESPPGVRRGHALPGPGARRRGFPARRGEPAPFYSRPRVHASAHPHPALPHPGETGRGPEPRDPGRARCALSPPRASSSRLGPGGRAPPAPAARAAWGHAVPGPGGSPGTRGPGRHTVRAPRARLAARRGEASLARLRGRQSSGACAPPGWRAAPLAPSARGSPRLQRETRGHALAPLPGLPDARLPPAAGPSCQKGGTALLGGRARAGTARSLGCQLRDVGTTRAQGQGLTPKGSEGKALSLPDGIGQDKGRKGSQERSQLRPLPLPSTFGTEGQTHWEQEIHEGPSAPARLARRSWYILLRAQRSARVC